MPAQQAGWWEPLSEPPRRFAPPLLEKEGRKEIFPLLPEEGCLRSRRGGGSLPEEGCPAQRRGGFENAATPELNWFKQHLMK